MSYHIANIQKGVYGELTKIYEEIDELKDAEIQQAELMIVLELADVIGAIEGYLKSKHPTISLADLIKMKDLTARAFESGHRS